MEKKYIIGMAKSTLKLNGGQRRNLELDVLRLIHFINMFENKEIKIYGYMIVYNQAIKNLIVNKWLPKYNFKSLNFEVLTFENEMAYLENQTEIFNEKKNNSTFTDSNSRFSKEIVENILINKIEIKFGTDKLQNLEMSEIKRINWDFQKTLIV